MTPDGGSPRVAFVGNVANSHFRAVRALRERGVDAHLFVSSTDAPSSRPENDLPELAGAYPAWIHGGRWVTPSSLLFPRWSRVVRELRRFDVVVASGPGPIFAQFAGHPWCFFATGGDLTVKPFPIAFRRWYPNWPHRAAELVAGFWQRRAARRATQVWLQPFAPMRDAARRLGIGTDRLVADYFPIVVDTDEFRDGVSVPGAVRAWVERELGDCGFAVFHPSRLVMERSTALERTGQWKGNDVLIRGFARWVQQGAPADAVLVLVDSPLSRDVGAARCLAVELGVDNRVRWLRPPDGRLFDRDHMVALYQRADVVVDEFGVGWFGYVALEGLAMRRPVIGHLDEPVMAKLYGDHPILNAADPVGVADLLGRLAADRSWREQVGSAGRDWVVRHHGERSAVEPYIRSIAVLTGCRISGSEFPCELPTTTLEGSQPE